MTVKFRTLKYKHRLQAQELSAGLEAGTVSEKDMVEFVVDLVETWDYTDIETGEPVAAGDYGELSIDQFTEVMELFNQTMQETRAEAVKKKPTESTNGSKSSYSQTGSKRTKRTASRPTHPTG